MGDVPESYVVIGGSKGALATLREIVAELDPELAATYIIALHHDPRSNDQLSALLSPRAGLVVELAREGITPGARTIYLAPPGHDLEVVGERFQLTARPLPGPRPSIDRLFSTVARTYQDRVIGVVLSGTGADGAQGLRSIREQGGLGLVEQPNHAVLGQMARAAQESGGVDVAVGSEALSVELNRVLRRQLDFSARAPQDDFIAGILTRVSAVDGVDFDGYKRTTIERRILRRLSLSDCRDLAEYSTWIQDSDDEARRLARDFLISVTEFFRDPRSFESLRRALRPMLEASEGRFRVWVPACSTGEEAYSIAMVLLEEAEELGVTPAINVFATDVDESAISSARRGIYGRSALRNVPEDVIARHFEDRGESFAVAQAVRDCIVFARQDVLKDPPFSRVDLISCRNLLIYLVPTRQRQLLSRFHYALVPSGLLLLGRSETVSAAAELFSSEDPALRLFRRVDRAPILPRPTRSGPRPKAERRHSGAIGEFAAREVLTSLGPPAVVVNQDFTVVHVYGALEGILRFPSGDMAVGVLDLVEPGLRGTVHATVRRAFDSAEPVESPNVVHRRGDRTEYYDLWAKRLATSDHVVLLFQHKGERPARLEEIDEHDQGRINELEKELELTRQQLRTTTDELAGANEDLESLNEELQSANEELQSSNEELETSNEELEATNEELRTVNEELLVRSRELADLNADVESVLAQMGLPLLVVNGRLEVRRRTPQAAELLRAEGSLDDFLSGTGPIVTATANMVREVVEHGAPRQRRVGARSRTYEVQASPLLLNGGEREAIVVLHDRTSELEREREFRLLVTRAPDVIARFDRELRILYVNPAIERFIELSAEKCVGKTSRQLGLPEALCQRWESVLTRAFATAEEGVFLSEIESLNGDVTSLECRIVPELDASGYVNSAFGITRDVTALLRAQQQSATHARELAALMESLPDPFLSLEASLDVRFANAEARATFDIPMARPNRPLAEVLPVALDANLEAFCQRVTTTQDTSVVETRFSETPGRWYEARGMSVPSGVALFLRDVHAMREAAQEKQRLEHQLRHAQKMEAVGTLAGGVAHEFNNLLAVIANYIEFVRENEGDPERWQHDLATIENATRRGSELSRRMLEFSGAKPAELRPMLLNRAVREVSALLRQTLPRIEVITELTDEATVILGDEHLLQQAVLTLAANARDAMPEGGRLTLQTHVTPEHVSLSVSDTGSGIAAEHLERIFEPFFTTKDPDVGTGLGLAMVYRLVQDLGGHIAVESELGRGTRFILTFRPSEQRKDDATKTQTKVHAPPERMGAGRGVLVVDDEPALRVGFRRMLERAGFRVLAAKSGEEALALFEAHRESLVLALVDLNMPGVGGEQTIAELARRAPQLPVIVSSGFPGAARLVADAAYTVRAWLQKPFTKHDLLETVARVLDA